MKKTDEQRHKKKRKKKEYIFCRLFFFLFSMLLALVGSASSVCMHTSVKIPIPMCSRSPLALYSLLLSRHVDVCAVKETVLLGRDTINVYMYISICI